VVTNRPWSAEEEALLTSKVAEFGPKWSQIAVSFEGRSDVNVKNRWAAMVSRNERIGKWEREKASAATAEVDPVQKVTGSLLSEWNLSPSDENADDF
jgi:hypothetical protein